MKIKQVEELVGITKKNIRFYEEQKLLNVERAENGYREYCMKDVRRLQEIKLLRKIDISLEEMRALFAKEKNLQVCLQQHLKELEHRKQDVIKMQIICERLISEYQSLEALNVEDCLEEIEKMEKEGARFMDVKKIDIHKRKRTGAVLGAMVMISLMLLLLALMIWASNQEPLPLAILLIVMAIPFTLIVGILIALIKRMKEIEGGEEDEASKY